VTKILETTIIHTATSLNSVNSNSGGGGVSGGEAAGIAIGVLAIIGIAAGGTAVYFRRKKARESYQKQFESSGPGNGFSNPFGTDQRLDPGMIQKRESVGSISDDQDYSRRILRVCFP
jgi:cell wall integrity and stress response component